MAVTATWALYNSIPPYNKTFDNLPYLPMDLTNNIKVFGMKFIGSEIDYIQIYLQDEFADIYYSDAVTSYRDNLITNADLEIYVTKFWVSNVKIFTVEDVGTDFGGVTYSNGTSGVGSTLTATNVGVFTHDVLNNFSVGDVILVKNQTSSFQNGIYKITVLGNDTTQWVLTRHTSADTALKLKDVVVVSNEDSTLALRIDQATPVINGSTAITFTTTLETEADLDSNFTWTNILARSAGDMVRFTLNSSTENRSLELDKRFEAQSYYVAIKLVRTDGTFDHFQVRNLKIMSQFKTKLPETSPRPVKIFSQPGVAVIRESMQIEYYLPTTTADNLTYNITGKTWASSDKIEVFKQPSGGVRTVVNPNDFLSSGASGNITFLTSQNPTTTITVTIARPLTEQGI
jgi:hypothetical protein